MQIRPLLLLFFFVGWMSGLFGQGNPPPAYSIATVTTEDAFGTADSFGVRCELSGVVHGIDFNGANNQLQFVLTDSTGSIWASGNTFTGGGGPYVVNEGDSVRIRGAIRQTNGLTRIIPQRVIQDGSGSALQIPMLVDSLNESHEASLVRFNHAKLVDAAQWTGAGAGFMTSITDGIDTIDMFIDNNTDLYAQAAPLGFFDVIGLVAQSDNSFPLDEGYFIMPRYSADLMSLPIPALAFDPAFVEVFEDEGSVDIHVSLLNPIADTVAVGIRLDSLSTATVGVEFLWTDTTIIFPANASQPIVLSIPLIDDAVVDGDEEIILHLENPTNGVAVGASPLTISLRDNEYPVHAIAEVTTVDPLLGLPDSAGMRSQLSGIVYGINNIDSLDGLYFTIIDSTGGIAVLAGESLTYSVNEGDEVMVQGFIRQFRGLTFIAPDQIQLLSSGNVLASPAVVTQMSEETESEFVLRECVKIIGNWAFNGPQAGFNVAATDGVDTFNLRIFAQSTDITSAPQARGWQNITGIGGQLAGVNPPFIAGYNLSPRYLSDFDPLPFPEVAFATAADTVMEGDGTISIDIEQLQGNPDSTSVTISMISSLSTATAGSDFQFADTTVVLSGKGTSTVELTIPILEDGLTEGNESFILLISDPSNQASIGAVDAITVTILDGVTGIEDQLLPADAISLYPIPAQNHLILESSVQIEELKAFDLKGREVLGMEHPNRQMQLDISHLPEGIYLIQAHTREGIWQMKWIKE
ncbi:MAG: Calx-beta domain-containing protein [Bacteroidota bacterium]